MAFPVHWHVWKFRINNSSNSLEAMFKLAKPYFGRTLPTSRPSPSLGSGLLTSAGWSCGART